MRRASPPNPPAALARFWQRDESLTALLVLLFLFAFVLAPLAPRDGPHGPLASLLFSLVLLAGVVTVLRQNRLAVWAVGGLCLAALALRWVAWFDAGLDYQVWGVLTGTIALFVLAVVVLAMVLRPGTVTRRRIEGAVAAYLLLGLAWAGAYEWVALRDPAAFTGAIGGIGASGASGGGDGPWIYYSLVTLTTMGYGDILPASPVARSLAVAEAFTGQLYLAILISRLVALELAARRDA